MATRAKIKWTKEETQAVAARTLQLRASTCPSLSEACRIAQIELLHEDRYRTPTSESTNYVQQLGHAFREVLNVMRNKSDGQLKLAVDIYLRETGRTLNVYTAPVVEEPPAEPKQAPVVETPPVAVGVQVQEPQPEATPVQAPAPEPTIPASIPPAPARTGLGAALEGALIGAMAPVIDGFMEQMRLEVRSAFERVQDHYTVQLEERLRHMLHTELAGLTPMATKTPRPKHNPEMIPVVPSNQPRYRIIIFQILDSQLGLIREAMQQLLSLHKVELINVSTKDELYRKHTKQSYVIYLPKWSNHLPPDYEKDNVKKMLWARGLDGIKDHIKHIVEGNYD